MVIGSRIKLVIRFTLYSIQHKITAKAAKRAAPTARHQDCDLPSTTSDSPNFHWGAAMINRNYWHNLSGEADNALSKQLLTMESEGKVGEE